MKLLRNLVIVAAAALFAAACQSGPSDDMRQTGGAEQESMQRPDPNVSWDQYTDDANNGYSDRVFFDTDRYNLDEGDRATITAWARWLEAHPGSNVLIEGHCDERGTREYNLALGARRAMSVRNYLIALGISPDRVRTVSYGKERPVDPRSTAEAWSRNRRSVAVPRQGGA